MCAQEVHRHVTLARRSGWDRKSNWIMRGKSGKRAGIPISCRLSSAPLSTCSSKRSHLNDASSPTQRAALVHRHPIVFRSGLNSGPNRSHLPPEDVITAVHTMVQPYVSACVPPIAVASDQILVDPMDIEPDLSQNLEGSGRDSAGDILNGFTECEECCQHDVYDPLRSPTAACFRRRTRDELVPHLGVSIIHSTELHEYQLDVTPDTKTLDSISLSTLVTTRQSGSRKPTSRTAETSSTSSRPPTTSRTHGDASWFTQYHPTQACPYSGTRPSPPPSLQALDRNTKEGQHRGDPVGLSTVGLDLPGKDVTQPRKLGTLLRHISDHGLDLVQHAADLVDLLPHRYHGHDNVGCDLVQLDYGRRERARLALSTATIALESGCSLNARNIVWVGGASVTLRGGLV